MSAMHVGASAASGGGGAASRPHATCVQKFVPSMNNGGKQYHFAGSLDAWAHTAEPQQSVAESHSLWVWAPSSGVVTSAMQVESGDDGGARVGGAAVAVPQLGSVQWLTPSTRNVGKQ